MKLMYAVVFEETPNNWCTYVPDVPGCASAGDTWEEMLAMIRKSLTGHIEIMLEHGDEPVHSSGAPQSAPVPRR